MAKHEKVTRVITVVGSLKRKRGALFSKDYFFFGGLFGQIFL